MPYCPNCGVEVEDDASYCPECGTKITGENASEPSEKSIEMTISTTNSIEDREIKEYLGIVSGEAMMGANIVKDFTAGIRNIIGGRSGQYEQTIKEGRKEALKDLEAGAREKDADAVIGVSFDYEEMSEGMLWINVTGTAVKLK